MSFLASLDLALFHLINITMANPFFDNFFPAITDLHKTFVFRWIFLPLVLAVLIYAQKLRGLIIFLGLGLSIGLSDYVGNIGKYFWQRTRPFDAGIEVIQRSSAGGYSFPSNHAINMFCMALFLSSFFPRYRLLFFIPAVLVAFSRVYNGVHFPFDVLIGAMAGVLTGILGAEVSLALSRKIENQLEKKRKGRRRV